jgi:hypothetical protein
VYVVSDVKQPRQTWSVSTFGSLMARREPMNKLLTNSDVVARSSGVGVEKSWVFSRSEDHRGGRVTRPKRLRHQTIPIDKALILASVRMTNSSTSQVAGCHTTVLHTIIPCSKKAGSYNDLAGERGLA